MSGTGNGPGVVKEGEGNTSSLGTGPHHGARRRTRAGGKP